MSTYTARQGETTLEVDYDPATQQVTEVLADNCLVSLQVVNITQETISATRAEIETLRRSAFMLEADPLFFGSERGENSRDEWFDKCAEIRQRYPYPGETP